MVDEPIGSVPVSLVATLERLAYQHPLIAHYARTRDSHPPRISDFISLSQFQRLQLHDELFRPLRINYQMAVTIPSPPHFVIGITFNRSSRDFSERERARLRDRAETAERALWSTTGSELARLTARGTGGTRPGRGWADQSADRA